MVSNTQNSRPLKPAVFLDRDGTINVEKEYLYRIEDFEFIPGAPEAIKKLKDAGYLVIVVTNQSGVARGYYSLEDVDKLHEYIQSELVEFGTEIDAFYVCPHHPTEGVDVYHIVCDCRKPEPGLLNMALNDFDIDISRSWIIGDKLSDLEAGLNAGIESLFVCTGHGDENRKDAEKITSRIFSCLNSATQYVLSLHGKL